MTLVSVLGLRRTFPGDPPVAALDGVDLAIADGTLVAVLGPSGCGKTTLLRTLAGMERPDEGTVTLAGALLEGPGTHVRPERRAIGLVPQEGALFPHLDVAGNVAFGLHGRPRAERRARVDEMLALVGLTGHARRRPHQLSGGQQQRVALARALAPAPRVVLLDEPFSALDTSLRTSVRDEVVALLRATGTTALLVTHDQTEAMTMADSLAVMRDGRIVQVGPPTEVYRRPVDPWTAAFLGEAVLVPGRRTGDRVSTALGDLPLTEGFAHAPGPEVTAFVRPEQVQPAENGAGGVPARVVAVRFQGPEVVVRLAVGDAEVAARWSSVELPVPGQEHAVAVAGTALAYPPPELR